MRDLIPLLVFGLFLLVAAWRGWRYKGYGPIAVLVVVASAALVGQRYVHQRAARADVLQLTPDRVAEMELDGRRIGEPEDVAAVVRCLQEAEWSFTGHALSRAVPLVVTLSDGAVRRYDVARSLDGSGARIHDTGRSAYSFSRILPQVLFRAGTPLP